MVGSKASNLKTAWKSNCLFISFAIAVLFTVKSTTGLVPGEITFLILSQNSTYHRGLSDKLQQNIIEQSLHNKNDASQPLDLTTPNIIVAHSHFRATLVGAAWAIIPALEEIYRTVSVDGGMATASIKTKWLVLCEEQTQVNLTSLIANLKAENHEKEVYFGFPLYDLQSTIIHHFAFFDKPTSFKYPFLRAGVVFTIPMLKELALRLMNTPLAHDFFIDASHELAMFAWNEGKGVRLSARPSFICAKREQRCALYPAPHSDCNGAVALNRIVFAVKTCETFHNTRLSVVMGTWAKYVPHLRIFSNVRDSRIPTIDIGVPNTKTGHCEKTVQIFRYIHNELERSATLRDVEWMILVDDDTLLGVAALAKYLACFAGEEHLYLGERYGYKLTSNGYSYITGGGGIVINRKVLTILATTCQCPSPTSPDDMIIATCLHHIQPIHSPLFRQARYLDYPPEVLVPNRTISFHKHWQLNPFRVYDKWFRQNDKQLYEQQRRQQINSIDAVGEAGGGGEGGSVASLLAADEFEKTIKNENNQYLQPNVDDVFKHSDL